MAARSDHGWNPHQVNKAKTKLFRVGGGVNLPGLESGIQNNHVESVADTGRGGEKAFCAKVNREDSA